jgi:hypothetical protein
VDSLPDLTDAELKEIEEVGRKVHFRHYKVGRERRRERPTCDSAALTPPGAHDQGLPRAGPPAGCLSEVSPRVGHVQFRYTTRMYCVKPLRDLYEYSVLRSRVS